MTWDDAGVREHQRMLKDLLPRVFIPREEPHNYLFLCFDEHNLFQDPQNPTAEAPTHEKKKIIKSFQVKVQQPAPAFRDRVNKLRPLKFKMLLSTMSCYITQHFFLVISLAKGQNSSSQETSPSYREQRNSHIQLPQEQSTSPPRTPSKHQDMLLFTKRQPPLFIITIQ